MFTVIDQTGKVVELGSTNMKPESMPAAGVVMFVHGAANVDWVTVWFLATNWNWTVSPALTPVSVFGV